METKTKILIIDDSDIDRKIMSQVLEKRGFEVISLASPESVGEVITTRCPDLVLMDIMMPGYSGVDVLQDIRVRYTQIDLPVIMFSGKTDSGDVVESLRLGANDYITKPINLDVALTRIRSHLKISELSKEMSRLRAQDVTRSIIATYNHEINNPLMIALGKLNFVKQRHQDPEIDGIEKALLRIAEIVKKIGTLSRQAQHESKAADDAVKKAL